MNAHTRNRPLGDTPTTLPGTDMLGNVGKVVYYVYSYLVSTKTFVTRRFIPRRSPEGLSTRRFTNRLFVFTTGTRNKEFYHRRGL